MIFCVNERGSGSVNLLTNCREGALIPAFPLFYVQKFGITEKNRYLCNNQRCCWEILITKTMDSCKVNRKFMDSYEVYQKLEDMPKEKYIKSITAADRIALELEAMTLRNAVLELGKYPQKLVMSQREGKRLKEDNERLRKAVAGIYETFKKKALKFIVESNIVTKDLNLFKEIFSSYLK